MAVDHITIRQGGAMDIDYLIGLLKELFSIERDFRFDEDKQRRGLLLIMNDASGGRGLFVAEKDGVVIGMCSVQVLISTAEGGPSAMVEDMIVAGAYRGSGIGRRLLTAMEKWAKSKGITRLQLLADRDNVKALNFYRKSRWTGTQLICFRKMI